MVRNKNGLNRVARRAEMGHEWLVQPARCRLPWPAMLNTDHLDKANKVGSDRNNKRPNVRPKWPPQVRVIEIYWLE